jgi:drug/metabolite transporter (DMT)-like permease
VSFAQARLARIAGASDTMRAILWMLACGVLFILLNGLLRLLAQQLDPFVTGFLRYSFGVVVMLPFILRAGWAAYRPHAVAGQVWRGAIHTAGLLLWFIAIPHVPLAEVTALGFTTPLFIMLGAMVFLGEKLVVARWVAALVGFGGVLVVVWPNLTGAGGPYSLVMLASAPLFAASFLITKALTKRDAPHVIVVWQSLMVAVFSLPFAVANWEWPDATQWALFALSGVLGTAGHICLTRAFRLADMSVTQPIKFLELVWAAILGFIVWSEVPGQATWVGGLIIFASTTWIARREARQR